MTVQVIAPKTRAAIPDTLDTPGIRQSDGINLDPMEVHKTGRLTAEIKRLSQGLLETDEFFVELRGWNSAEPRGSYTSPTLQFGPPNLRTLNLELSVVAFNLGQKMEVEYTVNRSGETSVTSETLELNILDLQPEDLKTGWIFGKDDDGSGPELDLTTNTEDRTLHIENWPLIAIGQWCWVVLKGEKANGDSYDKTLFKGQVDQNWITLGYIERPVPYSELKGLTNGSDLTLEYKVAFDQVDDEPAAHGSMVRSYTVKSALVVRPEIISMTDLNGVEIRNGGHTTTNGVKLKGTAAAGQEVRVFHDDSMDPVIADSDGMWEYEFRKTRQLGRFGAIASDGAYSAMWLVWFWREGVPVITQVTDSGGEDIPEYGATLETTVTLMGTAVPDEEVEVWATGGLKEKASVGSDGVWHCTLTGLKKQLYIVFVKALYGHDLESYAWHLNAVEAGTPVITSVTDSFDRAIPFYGSTYDQTVKLAGTARDYGELEIFRGGTPRDRFRADADGVWNYALALTPGGTPRIKVQALYGAGAMSPFMHLSYSSSPESIPTAVTDVR
ncbi:hypothetical protein BK659_03500 [Pseudomonas brassicacearum]|uniref:Uncharacterized protein n=1 Tax=Pseudomonas brassicacearum TaxID=930166 RepID=A0A423HBH9_9PSED|nr:hypothetical protein [Pseudomonas brassicacearum]RON10588.1 hypothetical protein BK659_03500 [Pseudomonas brassicacearum]